LMWQDLLYQIPYCANSPTGGIESQQSRGTGIEQVESILLTVPRTAHRGLDFLVRSR